MPKLSIIVPVYEEPRLPEVVEQLMKAPCPIEREWIFIDDRSCDENRAMIRRLRDKYGFLLLEQEVNQGKGAAIMRGLEAATGDYIVIQDADFEYDPQDIPRLLTPLLEKKTDVVYGSRFRDSGLQVHRTYHFFVNHFLTLLSNLLSGIYLTDMETCYKVFRADIIKAMNLKSRRFGFEVEVTAYIAKIGVRVVELPISYYPRTRLQGKKINWKDGLAALWHLLRFNVFTSTKKAFKTIPAVQSGDRRGVH